ncbi:hypothetical protein Scep_024078 [Stephania cephalantha]|uniref:Uncharacterized protein n=1 Tax=Stephania cephalantha TaxID=152367 RepID=A0AAP0HTD2_9MAGN
MFEQELNLGLLCNNLEKQSLFLLDALIKFEILRVLKWTFLYYLSFKAFHISWLPKLCSVQGSAISSNLKALFTFFFEILLFSTVVYFQFSIGESLAFTENCM